jgi:hypothetical protein
LPLREVGSDAVKYLVENAHSDPPAIHGSAA